MDTLHDIEEMIRKLSELESGAQKELEFLQQEVYNVKDELIGLGNTVKRLATRSLMGGLNEMLGGAYEIAEHKNFKNSNEYRAYLNQTMGHIRENIDHIEQVKINLQKAHGDLTYAVKEAESWLSKGKELIS